MVQLVVIIPTHDRNELLRRTLASLAQCSLPPGYARTIVVENGGRFGADAVVAAAAPALRAQYVYVEQGNKSAALNATLATAKDELLVFLDDDVRLSPGLLEAYESAAREYPGMFYGGPTGVDYESPPDELIAQRLPSSARGWQYDGVDGVVATPVMLGFNWAAHAEHLKVAGGFDASRGPGAPSGATGQESQMQRALIKRGILGKYVPDANVWHFVPKDRCSVAWLLERRYRTGVEHGLIAAQKFGGMLGIPMWTARKTAGAWLRHVCMQLVGDRAARLDAHLQWQVMKGCLSGLRRARREASSRTAPATHPVQPTAQLAHE
ncbi:MAG: glycosyltransferase [Pirellulales bacterium]|nr:glycosyltransferase [Pirellulales bacterium]